MIWVVLAGTALFSLTLLLINPVGAQDIYHDIADARTFWIYGQNPAVVPPIAHANDAFYGNVFAWVDSPSVYGPLWYQLSGVALPFAGAGLWANIIGQKLLTAMFLFGTTVLAILIVKRVRPGTEVAAGVMVGWNPLLQFDTAGNAHNDVVMIFFALACLYAVTRRWWIAVFPLLALSVASKHVLVLLAPVLLVWMLREKGIPRRSIALSILLGVALGAEIYAPYLAGGGVFASLHDESVRMISSTGAALAALLPQLWPLQQYAADNLVKVSLTVLFLLAYPVLLWRMLRNGGTTALLSTSFWAVFLFLVVAKWWFWPWYLLWLVPLGALLPLGLPALTAVVFSATAMLAYVPFYWQVSAGDSIRQQTTTAATAFVLPVLLVVVYYLRQRTRRSASHPR
jgi:hypothetical protein